MTHQNDTGEKPQAGDDVAGAIAWAQMSIRIVNHQIGLQEMTGLANAMQYAEDLKRKNALETLIRAAEETEKFKDKHAFVADLHEKSCAQRNALAEENAGLRAKVEKLEIQLIDADERIEYLRRGNE